MSDIAPSHKDKPQPAIIGAGYEVGIYNDLLAAEPVWRELEQRCVFTPYQRFDWISALMAAGAEPKGRIAIAAIRYAGRTIGLLPLVLVTRHGLTKAHLAGARQSNTDWLLAEASFKPTRAELIDLFEKIGRAVGGMDVLTFSNLPASWQDQTNPLLTLDHAPAASNLYTAVIGPTPVPYIGHRLTAKRRNNINRGRRRLEEQHGLVRLVQVQDANTFAEVHEAFLQQRGARLAEMGINNLFARAPFMQLFRELTLQSMGSNCPALCLHALCAGDEIVATSWGLQAGTHYSQYINSTTSGPAARFSLMSILIAELMDALTVTDITTFDMGLGDFEYKVEWTSAQPVYNSQIALSAKGRMAALIATQFGAAKRLIKQTPAFWQAAQAVRRVLFRLRRSS